jgi:hypothetical protein
LVDRIFLEARLHISRLVTGDSGVDDFDFAIGIESTQIAFQQPNVTPGYFPASVMLSPTITILRRPASRFWISGGGVAWDRDSLNMGIKE